MSGAAFDGLEGAVPPSQGEDYKPGVRGYSESLLWELIESYSSEGYTCAMYAPAHVMRERAAQHIAGLLRNHHDEEFDAQQFLNAVANLIWSGILDDESRESVPSEDLLNPLLQALHRIGYNGLTVDATACPPEGVYTLFDNLRGTKEEKLRLTLLGDMPAVGKGVYCCSITTLGNIHSLGTDARESEFLSKGATSVAGVGADESTYHLQSIEQIPAMSVSGIPWARMSKGCTYYVEQGLDDDEVVRYLQFVRLGVAEFFRQGNTLYEPDGKGGWTEVRP